MGGFSFPYYSKSKRLTKEHIFKIFQENNNLLQYLPDHPDLRTIPREFLLSVLFYEDREKYLDLYEEYKEIQIQKSTTGNKKFIAKITTEQLGYLRNYQPVNL